MQASIDSKDYYPSKSFCGAEIVEAISWALDQFDWNKMSKVEVGEMAIKKLGFTND